MLLDRTSFLPSLAVAAALAVGAGAANAALTVYTSQAAFLAAVSSPGVDTFAGLSTTDSTSSPLTRSAGSYGYTATSVPLFGTSMFYGAGTPANPWLSTNAATDTIRFAAFTGGVRAVGGLFFGSDVSGGFASGTIQVVATDSLGATSVQTINNATMTSFIGFTSTAAMTSVVVSASSPNSLVYPTVDNLTLAVPVPEPQAWLLMLTGAAALSAAKLRRRRRD